MSIADPPAASTICIARSRSGSTVDRAKDVPDPIDSPSEIAQAHEVFGRLRDLVPEEKRSILEMKAEGLSSKDIGERLGISERTVQRVLEDSAQTHGDGVGEPVMNLSASRRTWEEASSPAAVRLARKYEQEWRDSEPLGHKARPPQILERRRHRRRWARRAARRSFAPT